MIFRAAIRGGLAVMLALAACSGAKSSRPKSPEAAVRAFVEAVVRGDRAAAAGLLADAKACESLSELQRATCLKSIPHLGAQLDVMLAERSRFTIGKIQPSMDVPPGAPSNVKFFTVIDGKDPGERMELFVLERGDTFRVAFPLRAKVPPPP